MKPHVFKALGVAGIGVFSIFTFFITKNYVFDPAANLARVPEATTPKRGPVEGCMDKFACNFDPKATVKSEYLFCRYAQYVGGGNGQPYLPKHDASKPLKSKPVVTPEPNNCTDEECPGVPVSIRTWTDSDTIPIIVRGMMGGPKITFLGYFPPDDAKEMIGQNACDSIKLTEQVSDDPDVRRLREDIKKAFGDSSPTKPTPPSKKP